MERANRGILSHAHANIYCAAVRHFDDARLVARWDDDLARGQRAADQFKSRLCANQACAGS